MLILSVIPALRRLKKEDFQSRPAWATYTVRSLKIKKAWVATNTCCQATKPITVSGFDNLLNYGLDEVRRTYFFSFVDYAFWRHRTTRSEDLPLQKPLKAGQFNSYSYVCDPFWSICLLSVREGSDFPYLMLFKWLHYLKYCLPHNYSGILSFYFTTVGVWSSYAAQAGLKRAVLLL